MASAPPVDLAAPAREPWKGGEGQRATVAGEEAMREGTGKARRGAARGGGGSRVPGW